MIELSMTKKFLWLAKAGFIASLISVAADAKPYKGAEIFTKQAYKYGKFRMRMKAAIGSGILSTMFLWKPDSEMSGVYWEEVDVEVFGKDGATSWQSNIITGAGAISHSEGTHNARRNLASGFNVYEIRWTPNKIEWYVNGTRVRKQQGGAAANLRNEMQIRMNIWAHTSVAWVGPFDTSKLPATQKVDWVEYHKLNNNGSFTRVWRDNFNSFNSNRWGKANWTFDGNYADFLPSNAYTRGGKLHLKLSHQ